MELTCWPFWLPPLCSCRVTQLGEGESLALLAEEVRTVPLGLCPAPFCQRHTSAAEEGGSWQQGVPNNVHFKASL